MKIDSTCYPINRRNYFDVVMWFIRYYLFVYFDHLVMELQKIVS